MLSKSDNTVKTIYLAVSANVAKVIVSKLSTLLENIMITSSILAILNLNKWLNQAFPDEPQYS